MEKQTDKKVENNQLDSVLIEKFIAGNQNAFELLVKRYQNRVISVILRFVKNPDDASEIAQEVFLKVWKALPSFRGESSFYTWLYCIAANTAKNFLSTQSRRPQYTEAYDDEDGDFLDRQTPDNDTPENLLTTEELKTVIFSTIENLSEDLKMAITLREIEGLSYEEIAQIMDCPIGTVRSRIFRARAIIEEKMSPLLDGKFF